MFLEWMGVLTVTMCGEKGKCYKDNIVYERKKNAMKIRKFVKNGIAAILVATMVSAGALFFEADVAAAGTESYGYQDEIIYTSDITNAAELYRTHEPPTKAGYVFGGWFTDNTGTTQIEANENIDEVTLYAKFVPAYVLSIKAQNFKGIESLAKGKLRLVSGVDNSEHYKNVGFDVYLANKEEKYQNVESKKVYTKIIVKKSAEKQSEYCPEDVFGAQGHYFSIAEVINISKANYSSILYVKPYWTTNDGTKVYGLAKYVCVQDGIDGIISIPINLCTAEKVSCGMVEVTYPETLTFVGYQNASTSRLFKEFKLNNDTANHKIKCIGNIANVVAGDVAASTDLYTSLRFKIADDVTAEVGKTRFEFTIGNTIFCNLEEDWVDMSESVWDIQY